MILDTIKADYKTARIARDTAATALLSSLIGEVDKKIVGNPDVTTDEQRETIVLSVVKKFIDGAKEMIAVAGDRPDTVAQANAEIVLLDKYRPAQMSEGDLRVVIEAFKQANPGAKIGQYMGELARAHKGQYDGALAQRLVKEIAA
jgi:hypothetical protein